jgi:L-rhamnonate dehydratase
MNPAPPLTRDLVVAAMPGIYAPAAPYRAMQFSNRQSRPARAAGDGSVFPGVDGCFVVFSAPVKITGLRVIELRGTATLSGPAHKEPVGKPLDVYPEYRPASRAAPPGAARCWRQKVCQLFLRVETDAGVHGQIGPVTQEAAWLARQRLTRYLVGRDALATDTLWDVMYRSQPHGYVGLMMHAISAVDCALWDLKGKAAAAPLSRLLGGPAREHIAAYAQTKGMSHHPDHLLAQARALVDDGWQRLKIFFNHGPADGVEGMDRNVAVVRALREGLGADVQLMADAWRSWEYPYAREMLGRLEPFDLAWIEEPLRPELVAELAELRRATRVPIAAGEHHYTRWGCRRLLEAEAVDVLQPDPMWAGGISETLQIHALASAAGVPVCPHTHLLQPNAHLLAALPAESAPWLEYPVFEDRFLASFFLENPVRAVTGQVTLPGTAGLGMEWDESKIESKTEQFQS